MTRKDYELIARVVRDAGGYGAPAAVLTDDELNTFRSDLAGMFADELAATNPRFDRARFLKACGVQS